jgi:hypothetical protein
MEAKDKAKELVDRFKPFAHAINIDYKGEPRTDNGIWKESAKACALICVDEMLNAIPPNTLIILYNYWQQVKQEIEKL